MPGRTGFPCSTSTGSVPFARDGFEPQLRRQGSAYATLVREMMESLAVKIAEGRIALEELEWREVERLVGTVLQGLGFKCLVTPSARDKGRDLLVCDTIRSVIEHQLRAPTLTLNPALKFAASRPDRWRCGEVALALKPVSRYSSDGV